MRESSRFFLRRFLELYLFSSLVTITILWFYQNGIDDNFISKRWVLTCLLLGTYIFSTRAINNITVLEKSFWFPAFFIFQIICFVGIAFELQNIAGIYLAFIATCLYFYYFINKREFTLQQSLMQVGFLIFVVGFSYSFYSGLNQRKIFSTQHEWILFAIFAFWSLSVIYFGTDLIKRRNNSMLYNLILRKRLIKKEEKNIITDSDYKDRLFFHDLINQTHSIGLFLENKIDSKIDLVQSDMQIISKELEVIQTLVKNHFGFRHKNIKESQEYVEFFQIKSSIIELCNNYFSRGQVKYSIEYCGLLKSSDDSELGKCLIHYPSFTRILTNLIKNVSEIKSDEVNILFDYTTSGLKLEIKNKYLIIDSKKRYHPNGKNLNLINSNVSISIQNLSVFVKKILNKFSNFNNN